MYLKYVGEVTEVEDVVELRCGGKEGKRNLLVQLKGSLYQWLSHLNIKKELHEYNINLKARICFSVGQITSLFIY